MVQQAMSHSMVQQAMSHGTALSINPRTPHRALVGTRAYTGPPPARSCQHCCSAWLCLALLCLAWLSFGAGCRAGRGRGGEAALTRVAGMVQALQFEGSKVANAAEARDNARRGWLPDRAAFVAGT